MSDVGANCYVLRTNHRVQKWKCRGDVSMQARGIREFANRKRDERRFSEGVRVANDSEGVNICFRIVRDKVLPSYFINEKDKPAI